MLKAGVVGLGMIGGGVAACLVRSGQLHAVYDIRAEAAKDIPGAPAVSRSPRALAEMVDVVIIAVVSAEQAVAVLTGPTGVLATERPGMFVVLLSTVSMSDLVQLRALCDAGNASLIDCGVTGGPTAAQNGLICMVGGTVGDVASVKPILDGFAKSVFHMGDPGAGMAAKIARNTIFYGCLRAGYEGAVLCRNAGVDIATLIEVIAESEDANGGPMMLMGRDDASGNTQETALRESVRALLNKDLAAAIDLAASFGVTLPLAELTRRTDESVVGLVNDRGERA